MGDDDFGLRRHWLYGVSAAVNASISFRLICDQQVLIERQPSMLPD
jgi:hypothetical protein